jgi:hypothetical protein
VKVMVRSMVLMKQSLKHLGKSIFGRIAERA